MLNRVTHGQAEDRDVLTVLTVLQSIAERGELVQDELYYSTALLSVRSL